VDPFWSRQRVRFVAADSVANSAAQRLMLGRTINTEHAALRINVSAIEPNRNRSKPL
jgi:hypothetical protein